nr:Mu-like prophage major head subunit gpT family protein [Chelatococcus caeni]
MINSQNLQMLFKGFKSIYTNAFEQTESHYSKIAMTVSSSTREEEYGWLGQFPELREWIGDRHINRLRADGFKIRNRKFESTVEVKRDDIADDTIGLYRPMLSEMGRVTKQHPDTLVFKLLRDGFTTKCYDGQNFFDEEHPLSGPGTPLADQAVSNMQPGAGPAWFLLDTSREVKPIIWQEREKYEFQAVNDHNDTEVFLKDRYLYGIRARVNCGFGLWQLAFGSKAGLTPDNFADARSRMMDFRGDRGHLLGISPKLLVVPPALEADARRLLMADVIDGTSNIWRGAADLLVTHYVG